VSAPAMNAVMSVTPNDNVAKTVMDDATAYAAAETYAIDAKILSRYNQKAETIKKQLPKAKFFCDFYSWSGLQYKGVSYYIYPNSDFTYAKDNRCYEIQTRVKYIIKNYKKSLSPSNFLKKLGVAKGYVGTLIQHGLSADFEGLIFKYKGKTIMIALTDEGNITKSSNAYICAPDWLETLKRDTFIPVKVGSQSTHNEWLYQKYFTCKFDADSPRMGFQMWKEGEPERARFKVIRFGDGYSGELTVNHFYWVEGGLERSGQYPGRIYLSSKTFVIKYKGGGFPDIKSGKKYWYRCVNDDGYGGELITYATKKDYENKKALAKYHIGLAD
jgi:hypothetical protein